jgi:hypothetical protein
VDYYLFSKTYLKNKSAKKIGSPQQMLEVCFLFLASLVSGNINPCFFRGKISKDRISKHRKHCCLYAEKFVIILLLCDCSNKFGGDKNVKNISGSSKACCSFG